MIADVVDPVGCVTGRRIGVFCIPRRIDNRPVIDRPNHAIYDVVDVGEVAHHLAVVEYRYRCALDNSFRKLEQRHVRPAPRSINGKKTQTGARQPIEMGIAVRHQFVGFFCRGV